MLIFALIFPLISASLKVAHCKIVVVTSLALELPCVLTTKPLSQSIGAPPYYDASNFFIVSLSAGLTSNAPNLDLMLVISPPLITLRSVEPTPS